MIFKHCASSGTIVAIFMGFQELDSQEVQLHRFPMCTYTKSVKTVNNVFESARAEQS